ncbi:unnamed protein product [Fusarium equiseti]|uniref:Uncharacterized protein n=1 Tax=Fusarium equiseti TaxID=61235 RepID=A0A8J2IIC8_FUSEQ|nr:unnamed protein product [Fusarium equiseti]
MPCFEDLPVELINLIFSHLFLPYQDAWSEYIDIYPNVDVKALVSLTGTSRLCRSLALPIIFHSIRKTHRRKYIFNMFNSHQDLTQCTKAISLPFVRPRNSDYSDVQDTASRFGAGGPVIRSVQQGLPETAEVCLALALCSSVERLKIRLPDHNRKTDWNNTSFRPAFNLFNIISSQLGTVPCLRNLKYLMCYTRPEIGLFARFANPPELAIFGIPQLLELTPKIEVLVLGGSYDKYHRLGEPFDVSVCRLALESLVEIQLLEWQLTNDEDNDVNVLVDVLTATTRLKKFVYVIYGFEGWGLECPPRRLIDMLLPVQSTLQHLTLNYGERELFPDSDDVFRSEEMVVDPDQFRPFTHLETLEISQCVYCHHQFDRKAEGATYLANLLPPTIRKLTIYFPRHERGVQCMDCILYLGQRAVAGDFPALECLQINCRFHQIRRKESGRRYRRWRALRWTAEDAARKTMMYERQLADAARREEGRKDKIVEAFAGSGVEIGYKAWQTMYVDKEYYVLDA